MRVILIKPVPKLGQIGEIKEVTDGYGQNFLINKGLAKLATKTSEKTIKQTLEEKSVKSDKIFAKYKKWKKKLERDQINIKIKVGDQDQIYAGIHEPELLAEIKKHFKISLEKSQIHKFHPLKALGHHQIEFSLGHGITAKLTVNLIKE